MLLLDGKVTVIVSESVSESRKQLLTLIESLGYKVKVTITGNFVDQDTGEKINASDCPVLDLGYKFATILDNSGFVAEISLKSEEKFSFTVTGQKDENSIWSNANFMAIATKIAMSGKFSLSQIISLANDGKSIAKIKADAMIGNGAKNG